MMRAISNKEKTKTFAAILFLIAAIAFRLMFHAEPTESFEIASWNMRWFPSGYMEKQEPEREIDRIAKAARIIRSQGVPDVLFAQEIRDMETCEALAARLEDSLFKPVICSSFKDVATNTVAGLQQLAIFSRFSVVESGAEPWHATDFVFPPRGYAYAVLEVGTNLVAFFNVHLKSNYIPTGLDVKKQEVLNRLKRELSCRQILDKIDALRRKDYDGREIAAFVVGGDFNHSLYEDRFASENSIKALLGAGFENAFDGLAGDEWATLKANQWYSATTFDYILADSGLRPVAGSHVVFDEKPNYGISDHRQIRVTLSFGE